MTKKKLPSTPLDVFEMTLSEKFVFGILLPMAHIFRIWRRPRLKAKSDIERMSFLDKVYWLYKVKYPIRNPGTKAQLPLNKKNILLRDTSTEIIKLSAVGDLLNHQYLSHSNKSLYQNIKDDLLSSDLAMANLECCISQDKDTVLNFSTKKGPLLTFTPEEFDVVKGPFKFMATACNHSFDFKEEGLFETISYLEKSKISFNGINKTKEQSLNGTIIRVKDCQLGLVAHTFGLNGNLPPENKKYLVNHTYLNDGVIEENLKLLLSQINSLKNKGCNFIIAQLHWGWEHEFVNRKIQTELAHHLAERGVDLIIGHHPHVIQPVELYKTKRDSKRTVPIFYSLGNLINGFSADYLCKSLIAEVEILKDITEEYYVSSVFPKVVKQVVNESKKEISIIKVND